MLEGELKSLERDWRDLAAATRETDAEKLGQIIEELCCVLDQRQAQKQSQTAPPAKKSA